MRTDAEVRQLVIDGAYDAAGLLRAAIRGELRKRLREEGVAAGEDPKELEKDLAKREHSVKDGAQRLLQVWAQTVVPDSDNVAALIQRRAEVVAFLKTRPPEFIMALRDAGLELREVTRGESREARVLALREALAEPDEELKEALVTEGWER